MGLIATGAIRLAAPNIKLTHICESPLKSWCVLKFTAPPMEERVTRAAITINCVNELFDSNNKYFSFLFSSFLQREIRETKGARVRVLLYLSRKDIQSQRIIVPCFSCAIVGQD